MLSYGVFYPRLSLVVCRHDLLLDFYCLSLKGKLVDEEERETGGVAFNVYKSYWRAVGHILSVTVIIFLLLMQGLSFVSFYLALFLLHLDLQYLFLMKLPINLLSVVFNDFYPLSSYKPLIFICHPVYSWQKALKYE